VAEAVRVETDGGVRRLVLCRPAQFNTITPDLRDQLDDALERADRDRDVKVVLLAAEGKAFCAGFGLDWSTLAQASAPGAAGERVWDSVDDVQMIGRFGNTFAKLHSISKPTLAAVRGWCVAGGTDMVLNADLIIAGESARFGYPPARVWGVPEAPWVWVARLGLERAKRYLFTGDELTGTEAAAAGMVLECVPDDELDARADALAHRIALLPLNQLQFSGDARTQSAERVTVNARQKRGEQPSANAPREAEIPGQQGGAGVEAAIDIHLLVNR
jgi:enoyl-CoA hydratase